MQKREPRRESAYSHPKLSNHDLRRVAVEAVTDPRTVVRYLRGKPMNANTRIHVERALVACGFGELVRASSSSAGDDAKANGATTNGAAVAKAHPMLERRRG